VAFQTFAEAKDPAADLKYVVTISTWFPGETVDASLITVTATGCELHDVVKTATTVTFWARGGTAETDALITITATTTSAIPNTDQRTLRLPIRER